MSNVLFLFAHPALERSRVNAKLIERVQHWPDVSFRDLYELYPDFHIDVAREQEQLLAHRTIVWQFPLYWYSTPPLLKQWMDLTLEHGWAYGSKGIYLRGKRIRCIITAGGGAEAYCEAGYNGYTLEQFLRPLEQTAKLCGMDWQEPYVIHGTHAIHGARLQEEQERYEAVVRALVEEAQVSHPQQS